MALKMHCVKLLFALASCIVAARAVNTRTFQAPDVAASAAAPDAVPSPRLSAAAAGDTTAGGILITLETNMSKPTARLVLDVPSLDLNTQVVVARANASRKQQGWSAQPDGTLRGVAANGSVTGRWGRAPGRC
mgnify:CR=1 FL=1